MSWLKLGGHHAAGFHKNGAEYVISRPAGSGKTTSTGKIARWLAANQQRKPLLLSTDVYRPRRATVEGHAKATGQSIFEKPETNDPLELTREALKHARDTGYDTLLIDTPDDFNRR